MTSSNHYGFELHRTGKVARIGPTKFVVQTENGTSSFQVELKDGRWNCSCDSPHECAHRYAAQLTAMATRTSGLENRETELTCRSCGSPDLSRCGFRYNAYGMSRRYRCNECLRKFSVPFVEPQMAGQPLGSLWLLSEVAMLTSKLTELLAELNRVLQPSEHAQVKNLFPSSSEPVRTTTDRRE